MSRKGINPRSLTAFIVTWAFAVAVVTGIVLYVVPHGRVAHWVNWSLLGLTSAQWANVHIILGAIFIVSGVIHLYFNWKPFKKYLAERAQGHIHVRQELVISSVFCVLVIVAAIGDLPPVSWVFQLNEAAKDSWVASPEFEPPYGHAEETSLAGFSRRMGMNLERVVDELRAQGVELSDSGDSLKAIAAANGTNAMEIYRLIKQFEQPPVEATEVGALTPEFVEEKFAGTGVGRKTPGEICAQIGYPAERARDNLARVGIGWSDERMKAIAERSGVDSMDVLKAMLVEGYVLTGESS